MFYWKCPCGNLEQFGFGLRLNSRNMAFFMEELMTESIGLENVKESRNRWVWLYRIFIQPRRIFKKIANLDGSAWLMPMLILTVFVLLLAALGGPARQQEIQMNMGQPPEDFQYWSEEQQNQYFEGQTAMQGPLFVYVFPVMSALAGLWGGWFIMSSLLLLLMTFKGSRQPQVSYLNLVAWAALPFVVRSLVQLVAVVSTQREINNPGLSGFIDAGESALLAYAQILLSFIDLYSIWFVLLLLIGAPLVSKLKPDKSLPMTVLAILLFFVLASIPGFAANQLGGLGTIRPFLFF